MKKISVIVIGAGNRGNRYSGLMAEYPEHYELVGMADPEEARRKHFHEKFGIPEERCYLGWKEILAEPKMADVAIIATVDTMHYEPALLAIEKGYDLLLEKPVAPTAKECADIAAAARKKGTKVLVGHVLRYAPFFCKVKELVMDGAVGEVVSVDQVEGVGNVHFSHSYVRGNWHKESESAPMLLAKSSHDLDMIQWIVDKPCKKISSFGSLTHFVAKNAPEGAPVRCCDGNCPVGDTCPYNCSKHYVDFKTNPRRRIITRGFTDRYYDPTDEDVMHALRNTDYGLCVYHANNDVVDHQVVNMEFEGGITATLNVNAFNKGGRYIRVYGTKGELYAHAASDQITVYHFESNKTDIIKIDRTDESINGGHDGGDQGLVKELHQFLSGDYKGYRAADIDVSVRNHFLAFAAEASRHEGVIVDMDTYYEKYGF